MIGRAHNWPVAKEVMEYLKEINSGVVGYRVSEREKSEEERRFSKKTEQFTESIIHEKFGEEIDIPKPCNVEKVVELEHQGVDKFRNHFPIEVESAGTLKLLSVLPKVFNVLKTGGVIVVDELDLSLHTHAAEKLIRIFCTNALNPNGAQILTTTHDTNLMEINYLRRDQIWFVDKNHTGSTQIYPLTDFRTPLTDNIEKGYLQSRFGSTPI